MNINDKLSEMIIRQRPVVMKPRRKSLVYRRQRPLMTAKMAALISDAVNSSGMRPEIQLGRLELQVNGIDLPVVSGRISFAYPPILLRRSMYGTL